MKTTPEQNKKLVLEAFDTLFNKRDYAAAEKFWSPNYIQHSALVPAGRDGLFNLVKNAPKEFRWEQGALLDKSAHPDYRSYHTNEEWLGRDQLAGIFKNMGGIIPDLRWEIKDIQVIGDQIVVRGKATGTPKAEFWGAKPTGKSFDTMALDIFTVKDGKLASCYHVERIPRKQITHAIKGQPLQSLACAAVPWLRFFWDYALHKSTGI